jgi:hypothetical protein
MATRPKSIQIRAYQVGFGDCFLMSFVYGPEDKRHLLIDFGTTGLRGRGKKSATPSHHMPLVANDIAKVCDGQLTAVIATHRHADHISGFGTDTRTGKSGDIIKSLHPRVVLQPWTEDPDARRDATHATRDSSRSRKSFAAGLAAKQQVAQMVYDIAHARPSWMGPQLQRELSFLGQENIKNESAVRNLIAMGQAKGATAVWARYGSPSGLEKHLPGVKVTVLGPPDLRQTEKIRTMRSKDPDQFWHLLAGTGGSSNLLANGLGPSRSKSGRVPVEARWFRDRLEKMRGTQLLEIVRSLDSEMNNTSVILLFEVFGKKLLFPGDAQIENWSYALEDAPEAKRNRAALADVDVYKVGHHGSLNATPKKLLWEAFSKRGGKGLHTLLSTLPGKHGKARNKTEVPRRPLLAALEAESALLNTNKLPFGAKPTMCHLLEITP